MAAMQVSLELDSSVRFKEKLELKKKVIDNGGIISFIVTKKVFTILIILLHVMRALSCC